MIQPDRLLQMFAGLYESMTQFYNNVNRPIGELLSPGESTGFGAQFLGFILDFIGLFNSDFQDFIYDTTLITFIIGGSITFVVIYSLIKWFTDIVA